MASPIDDSSVVRRPSVTRAPLRTCTIACNCIRTVRSWPRARPLEMTALDQLGGDGARASRCHQSSNGALHGAPRNGLTRAIPRLGRRGDLLGLRRLRLCLSFYARDKVLPATGPTRLHTVQTAGHKRPQLSAQRGTVAQWRPPVVPRNQLAVAVVRKMRDTSCPNLQTLDITKELGRGDGQAASLGGG
jgi:hypothetical protein